jgi:hypothetical protein
MVSRSARFHPGEWRELWGGLTRPLCPLVSGDFHEEEDLPLVAVTRLDDFADLGHSRREHLVGAGCEELKKASGSAFGEWC